MLCFKKDNLTFLNYTYNSQKATHNISRDLLTSSSAVDLIKTLIYEVWPEGFDTTHCKMLEVSSLMAKLIRHSFLSMLMSCNRKWSLLYFGSAQPSISSFSHLRSHLLLDSFRDVDWRAQMSANLCEMFSGTVRLEDYSNLTAFMRGFFTQMSLLRDSDLFCLGL